MRVLSVCVPVYGTEVYLLKCLESIASQSFKDFEVIVVNDGSTGVDCNGRSCKEIIKDFKKNHNIKIKYIEHGSNKGLLEARRTAVYAAHTDYILNLDSDDTLNQDALMCLYKTAIETNADIVQGNSNVVFQDDFDNSSKEVLDKKKTMLYAKLKNHESSSPLSIPSKEIFDSFLVKRSHNGFVWARLIKTDLYKRAFDYIPPIFCIFAEDFLQSFWLNYEASSYVQISDFVHNYNISTGISSNKKITDISDWEKVCSTSSVFTAIYSAIKKFNISLSNEQADRLVTLSYQYVANNIIQLNKTICKDIYQNAYNLLCDYWGKDLVEGVEAQLYKQGVLKKM